MPFIVPDLPTTRPATTPGVGPAGEEQPVILPFMSYTWSAYAGRYATPFVTLMTEVDNAAPYAAKQLLRYPKGRRVLFFHGAEDRGMLFRNPNDRLQGRYRSLWVDKGIAATKAYFANVVELLWANKADIDFAVFDMETLISCWTLSPDDLAAIYADPRYKDLVATGRFPKDCRNMNVADAMLFNFGCAYINDAAIRASLITPLYKRYNNVNWCNYADAPVTKADAPMAPDFNDAPAYYAPSSAPYYAPVMNAYIGNLGVHDPRFKESWYVLALACNSVIAIYRAKATAKIMPWLAPKVMSNVFDWTWWQEQVFHACCLTGTNMLYFNADDPSPLSNWRFDNAIAQYVSNARGQVWKSCLTTTFTSYDTGKFVLSAAKLADGSMVGRVTFKPGVNSAKVTVEGKVYTANRAGDTPGAWIHS